MRSPYTTVANTTVFAPALYLPIVPSEPKHSLLDAFVSLLIRVSLETSYLSRPLLDSKVLLAYGSAHR